MLSYIVLKGKYMIVVYYKPVWLIKVKKLLYLGVQVLGVKLGKIPISAFFGKVQLELLNIQPQ